MSLCWISGGEDIKNGKENNKTSGVCEAGMPLGTNATKCIGVARQKLGMARWYNIPESKN
ncbi:hypothetical protein AHAS_Ahas09G0137900 [Arachis hypogaea]